MRRRVDPDGAWFCGRLWLHFDEAFWVGNEGDAENFLAGVRDFVGLTLMDLIRRHETNACVMMVLIGPIEKVAAEQLCVLDAVEALWELRLVFQGLEAAFGERIVV